MLRLILILAVLPLCAETPASAAARKWREAHEGEILREFVNLLRIPNVASDRQNIQRNAGHIRSMMAQRGIAARVLETPGAPAAVFGELLTPGARETVLFYAHVDGQPVDPKEWTGSAPFEPVLRDAALDAGGKVIPFPAPGVVAKTNPEWRLYGRSTSDDKAPIVSMLAALDALKAAGLRPTINIKFLFEGEEEAGSASLGRILEANRELVKADYWLICDGPVHQTRRPQLYFGARGVVSLNLTVYGPRRELHSGHYGNWAPNPAMMLARLLASMKDDAGRVLIRGWYDGLAPLSAAEKQALAEEPAIEADLKRELLLAGSEGAERRLSEAITEPSLNIRGLASAAVGAGSRNVVPATATASIDIRLVKGADYRALAERFIAHVRAQGYYVTDTEPDASIRLREGKVARISVGQGYNAVRTPMDLPESRQVIRALEAAAGPVVKLPTLGGSVPLSIIQQVVNVPMIGVPIANHDNNQHSANENIRLANLWYGIEAMAALFTMPAR